MGVCPASSITGPAQTCCARTGRALLCATTHLLTACRQWRWLNDEAVRMEGLCFCKRNVLASNWERLAYTAKLHRPAAALALRNDHAI